MCCSTGQIGSNCLLKQENCAVAANYFTVSTTYYLLQDLELNKLTVKEK